MAEQINDDFFNREEMESNRFMGEIITFEIREGSKGKATGEKVLYMEIANLTRPLPWGNWNIELLPGRFQKWTKTLAAWEKKIGIKLDNKTIPTIKKKYQYLWWSEEKREDTKTLGKFYTDIYPNAIPTKEEIAKVLEGQEQEVASDTEEVKTGTVIPPGPTPPSEDRAEIQNLVMSIIDGLTSQEVKDQIKDINDTIPDTEIMRAVGDLMIAGKVKMVAKKYKVQK